MSAWLFHDPQNVAVITLRQIIFGEKPILYVSHDADDGGWQFLDGGQVREEDAAVVSLANMVQHDASVQDLADLPLGWCAWRTDAGKGWQRAKKS
jgi:hypothetical protein